MKVYNELELLTDCLRRWDTLPSAKIFEKEYLKPMYSLLEPMLSDFGSRWNKGLYDVVEGLDWETYRKKTMDLDPGLEESRLRRSIESVEKLLGTTLTGEAVLFGSFTSMDGYARFEKGEHRVFLGVDENHGPGSYLDILITHELTHVARESVPEVWEGFGLNPKMTHDEFVENMPVIEHLMSEGFSCVVSELLNPKEDPWNYAYQTEHSLPQILLHGPAVDHAVHAQLAKGKGEYHELYDVENYTPVLPRYAHYVWAWQWVKHLLKEIGKGDPKKLLGICSKELQNDALEFKLPKILL